jgi:microcystin-dependent protein
MDYLLGEIILLPYGFEIEDCLTCRGQSLPIMEFQALYALIGPKFGGNGTTHFNLPDLRGAEPIPGMGYYIVTNGMFPQRQ